MMSEPVYYYVVVTYDFVHLILSRLAVLDAECRTSLLEAPEMAMETIDHLFLSSSSASSFDEEK
jgi:hypothetical protein